MANPQLENGHTQIANEILEHLMRFHLAPNQWQVLLCIIRKTYGFHKKVDHIANSQIVEATELCKSVVSRTLHDLNNMKVITRQGKLIGFQKDWEQWGKLAELLTDEELAVQSTELAVQSTELAVQSTKVSSPLVTQKKKETIQKKLYKRKNKEFNLPEWLNKETWEAFIEMRKIRKSMPTEKAKELLIKELERLKLAGDDPTEVLNRSIMNSWKGVFPLDKRRKEKAGGKEGEERQGIDPNKGLPISMRTKGHTPEEYRQDIAGHG